MSRRIISTYTKKDVKWYSIFMVRGIFLSLMLITAPLIGDEVLDYWFNLPHEMWFRGGPAMDAEVTALFTEALLREEKSVEIPATSLEQLSRIIILDQFSRHIYRGSPDSFKNDHIALHVTLTGIIRGDDLKLSPVERRFYYMPLMHSEDLHVQQISLIKFRELVDTADEDFLAEAKMSLHYAHLHHDVIATFGRFPHRNTVLSRESTPDELAYLTDNPNPF